MADPGYVDITLPSGQIVSVPQEMTKTEDGLEEISDIINQTETDIEVSPDYVGGMSRAGLSGLMFGFGNEFLSAVRAGVRSMDPRYGDMTSGEHYEQAMGDITEEMAEFRKQAPVASTLSELGGALATGGFGTARLLGVKALRDTAAAIRYGKYPVVGAVEGAIAGAGYSEDDRLGGALSGGSTGAALGAVAPPVGYLANRFIAKPVTAAIQGIKASRNPELAARRALSNAIEQDALTPSRVAARAKTLGPQSMMVDAGGENVMGLGRGIAGVPGPSKQRAMTELRRRAEGEGVRIGRAVNEGLGGENFYNLQDELLDSLRTRSSPFYREAYENYQSIMTPSLKRLLGNNDVQKALGQARRVVDGEYASGKASYLGAVDEELTAAARYARDIGKMDPATVPRAGVAQGFSLETWDQIKRGFDTLLDSRAYKNELTGKLNKLGSSINLMKNTLTDELDSITGGAMSPYSRARAIYSGDAEVVSALANGRKALRIDPEVIAREMEGLSEAGQAAYRTGAARAIKDMADRLGDQASAAQRIFGNQLNRSRIRALFPDQKSFNDFSRSMVREMRFSETKNAIGSGSRTAPMAAESVDALQSGLGRLGAVIGSELPMGGHSLVKAGIGREILGRMAGENLPEYQKLMSQMMFTKDPAHNLRVLDNLSAVKPRQVGEPPEIVNALGRSILGPAAVIPQQR